GSWRIRFPTEALVTTIEAFQTAKTLALRHDRPVPRYTSYPTAPHFHNGIGPVQQGAWLAASDEARPASLYIHVPYCRQMCWYCGCHTKIVARYSPVADFVARLNREMELVAAALGARRRIGQLHWGGGTPNTLAPDDLRRLMQNVRSLFDF